MRFVDLDSAYQVFSGIRRPSSPGGDQLAVPKLSPTTSTTRAQPPSIMSTSMSRMVVSVVAAAAAVSHHAATATAVARALTT
ncbi:hypothetical protein EGR_07142 [Echinococcus granulosus]|uniref:Uncharacterized protein n=1 Tax=Echinococcus granulosus TaxID=6210 RepID=W6UBV4_ECHGR|nr:hypothetical protein EGR_07142 [Echinococcus granulosus]EUB58036.1 hypothetical protein EGR_07142 [Echinococcus granulosus]